MATFVLRLISPRPTFALDASSEEREIMARHAAHWQPYLDAGQMVVWGPIMGDAGSWGLTVIEADDKDEQELHSFAEADPAVTTGTATLEFGRMLTGVVRGR